MADPLSISASIAAILQLSVTIVKYLNDVKGAPDDRKRLNAEIISTIGLLSTLQHLVQPDETWSATVQSLNAPKGPLEQFRSALERLAKKLSPVEGNSAIKLLAWPFQKGEVRDMLYMIERQKALLNLALQNDHFKLLQAIKDDNSEVKNDIREAAKGVAELRLAQEEPADTLQDENRQKIYQWLLAPDPSSNHNAARKKQQPKSGLWFVEGYQFAQWKATSGSMLWIHGIPGCGKTILCSTIIEDIISHCQSDSKLGVAYFYFDFNDSEKQRHKNLIRSLIKQLSIQGKKTPEALQKLYSCNHGQQQPSNAELFATLQSVIRGFTKTYIIIDALDECIDRDDLLELIRDIKGEKVQILVTSRKENDIEDALKPLIASQICIQSANVDGDIQLHIRERLQNDKKLKRWPVKVQEEIEEALMDKAHGMFRWVVCQLDALRRCLKVDALRKTLKSLPKTLDETYDRILLSIDQEYIHDALKVFQWLAFSIRPVRIDEVAEVLAVDLEWDPQFDPEKRLLEPRDLLLICSSLVTVSPVAPDSLRGGSGGLELKLAHFSVKEYLISQRIRISTASIFSIVEIPAHLSIIQTCLIYLLQLDKPDSLNSDLDQKYPLARYAARYWTRHLEGIEDISIASLDPLTTKLFCSGKYCFQNWIRIWDPDSYWWEESDLSRKEEGIAPPLYYASLLDMRQIVQQLLDKGADINARGGYYDTALHAASHAGHSQIVQWLLDKGADINAESKLKEKMAFIDSDSWDIVTALHLATRKGHETVTRMLLERGADVNAEAKVKNIFDNTCYKTALQLATEEGYEAIVRLLLEKGANINVRVVSESEGIYHWDGETALHTAAGGGHETITQLLLEKKADVNAKAKFGSGLGCWTERTALHLAAENGYKTITRLLLKKGADVDAKADEVHDDIWDDSELLYALCSGSHDTTALHLAAREGHEDVAQLLLESRANIAAKDREGKTALHEAARGGHAAVVRLLLKSGASIATKNKNGRTVLHEAAVGGYDVVWLLLEKGADIDAKDIDGKTALHEATARGYEAAVQLLLEKGIDINAKDNEGYTPLHHAVGNRHEAVVWLLLEQKADVDAKAKYGVTALHWAAIHGQETMVRLLLKFKADANGKAKGGVTALQLAATDGHETTVRLLLEYKVDVDAEAESGKSALYRAAQKGHLPVVRLLLEHNADVEVMDEYGRTALHRAAQNGHLPVMRLLLEHSADVEVMNKYGWTALHQAAQNGDEAVMRLLLKHKADVEMKDRNGQVALHLAAQNGHKKAVRLLLAHEADSDKADIEEKNG